MENENVRIDNATWGNSMSTTIRIPYPTEIEIRDGEYHCKATDCYQDEVYAHYTDCYLALGQLQGILAAKRAATEDRTEEVKKLTDEVLAEVLQSCDPPVEIRYDQEWARYREDDGSVSETNWVRSVHVTATFGGSVFLQGKVREILEEKGVSRRERSRALLRLIAIRSKEPS